MPNYSPLFRVDLVLNLAVNKISKLLTNYISKKLEMLEFCFESLERWVLETVLSPK